MKCESKPELTRSHLEIKENSIQGKKRMRFGKEKFIESTKFMLNQKSNNDMNKASLTKHESY